MQCYFTFNYLFSLPEKQVYGSKTMETITRPILKMSETHKPVFDPNDP